ITIGSTVTGLHPNDLRRVDWVAGNLTVRGGGGDDRVIVDDSGDDDLNVGELNGATVSGLDMAGAVIVDDVAGLEIRLGADGNTFYVPATRADITTTVRGGDDFDRVYVGAASGQTG